MNSLNKLHNEIDQIQEILSKKVEWLEEFKDIEVKE